MTRLLLLFMQMEAALQMLKKTRDVLRTSPMAEWIEHFAYLPGVTRKTLGLLRRDCPPRELFDATDDQLRELIRATATTTWHYSCTARMGPADGPLDEYACDPRLRVRGVTGLRVADCSVMPFVVSVSGGGGGAEEEEEEEEEEQKEKS